MSEVTYIKEAGIYCCNNCGAYSSSKKDIKHHFNCKKGESKKWEKIYDEENKEKIKL